MKSKNKIIVCQDKEVFLYNTILLRKEWSVEIKHKIGGIARFDKLVLISSYNWWGKVFSKLLIFHLVSQFWILRKIFYHF